MNEVVDLFYPETKISNKELGEITGLVNQCAIVGDQVSQDILIKIGKFIGEQTAGVIKQVGIESDEVPVVIGGRVFNGSSPLLIDEFKTNLHRTCPKAYILYPRYKPVVGAYLFALDELNIKQDSFIEQNLDESSLVI